MNTWKSDLFGQSKRPKNLFFIVLGIAGVLAMQQGIFLNAFSLPFPVDWSLVRLSSILGRLLSK